MKNKTFMIIYLLKTSKCKISDNEKYLNINIISIFYYLNLNLNFEFNF